MMLFLTLNSKECLMGKNKIGYIPKQRNSGSRETKRIILIVAEGNNQTETNYFKKFETTKYRIKFVHSNDTDPIKMMKALQKQYEEIGLQPDEGDLGMSLIDTDCDSTKDVQILEADRLSTEYIRQYISSPCFEIWLLCHFECSTKQYNTSTEVVRRLKKHIKDYSKNDEEIYQKTKLNLDKAKENAKILNKKCIMEGKKPHTVDCMPSTEIVNIIEILQNLK